jgi:predicted negative regulator of RcsB-dependent stress response
MLNMLAGCVRTKTAPEMAWVRTDGRRIADDPALLQQGKTDIALCHADLDAGSANETARACMSQRGYALVQKDQAEDVRAAYATAAQRASTPNR